MKTEQKSMRARFKPTKSTYKNKSFVTLGYGDMSPNNKVTSDKSPTLTGKLQLSSELLQELIDKNHGDNVTIPVSGWIQQSKYSDNEYISIMVSMTVEN